MADPLSLADFFDGFRVTVDSRFYLPGTRQHSRTASGEVLTAVLGHQLWRGEVTAYPSGRQAMRALQAQLEDMDRAGDPFLIHPFPCGPSYDPDGSIIAPSSPTIYHLPPFNPPRIGVEGLPSGYQIGRGDFLSFTYGADPTRYALHRVISPPKNASGGGQVLLDVTPHIRPGAVIGAAVTLYKPVCKAIIVPDSIQWPGYGDRTIRFNFIQTLR